MTSDEAVVRHVLRRAARRLWLRRVVRRVLGVTAVASCSVCLVLLAARLGYRPPTAHVFAVLGVLWAAAVAPALRRVRTSTAAATLDAALGTHERFTTALACMGLTDAMPRLVVRDTARLSPTVDLGRIPGRTPLWPAIVVALAVSVAVVIGVGSSTSPSLLGAPGIAAPGAPAPAAATGAPSATTSAGNAPSRTTHEPSAVRREEGGVLREVLATPRRDSATGAPGAQPRADTRTEIGDPRPSSSGSRGSTQAEPAAVGLPGAGTASGSGASTALPATHARGAGVTTRTTSGAGDGHLGGRDDAGVPPGSESGASVRTPVAAAGSAAGTQRTALPPALRHYVVRYFQVLATMPEAAR